MDSVLRGNVVAEIEAALAALRLKRCLLVSANPNAGRIIRAGRYFIRGTPLHHTDFRNDPRHPRLSAKVTDLLGPPARTPLTILRAGTKTLREGIYVGEARTFEDVQHWASRVDSQTLAVGGADFFQALLLKHGHRSVGLRPGKLSKRPATSRAGGRRSERATSTLFVCGSLAESSRKFLAECRAKGWPVLRMPDELLASGKKTKTVQTAWTRQINAALRTHPRVAVGIGRPRLEGSKTPLRLGRILTDTVKRVLSVAQPARLCVEGGATTAQLLERMNWRRLRVEVEFATGVTGARAHRCPEVLLICKPGSYAWPQEVLCSSWSRIVDSRKPKKTDTECSV